jgi:hypothetical protein
MTCQKSRKRKNSNIKRSTFKKKTESSKLYYACQLVIIYSSMVLHQSILVTSERKRNVIEYIFYGFQLLLFSLVHKNVMFFQYINVFTWNDTFDFLQGLILN